ncbi:MAG: anion permease, partial [Deltaproteobacteria bacterium]|nr:anion permease [Deltaproteobacteria bacterium]
MSIEIDTRPIWVILLLKALRPAFYVAVALVFWGLVSMPTPEGLSPEGQKAIAIFAVCLILWVSNVVPLAITSLFAIVLVPVMGVLPTRDTYALFGNEAVFFILGAFILAGAIMHVGLSTR